MSLRVISAYGSFTLVGPPVLGRRSLGYPPGGPFDSESYELANALAGNAGDAQVWELAMPNVELECLDDCTISVVGGQRIESGAYRLRAGELIRIEAGRGCRSYLATTGGFSGQTLAGSLSSMSKTFGPSRRLAEPPESLSPRPLRLVLCSGGSIPALTQVSLRSDRVGLRLEGSGLERGPDFPSEPCTPGTVQVAGDGVLLVHGPDGPTIGGYTKLGVVARVDFDRLGQLRPGESVCFEDVSAEEARELWARERRRRDVLLQSLRLAL